ncbi:MAG: hypothetical protein NTY08_00600 [Proteobacteria bacterium]|nr:hypothetical protein [Pseudomonadota bacterium]
MTSFDGAEFLERLKHFTESQKLQKLKDYRHACDYANSVKDIGAKVDTSLISADGIDRNQLHRIGLLISRNQFSWHRPATTANLS